MGSFNRRDRSVSQMPVSRGPLRSDTYRSISVYSGLREDEKRHSSVPSVPLWWKNQIYPNRSTATLYFGSSSMFTSITLPALRSSSLQSALRWRRWTFFPAER